MPAKPPRGFAANSVIVQVRTKYVEITCNKHKFWFDKGLVIHNLSKIYTSVIWAIFIVTIVLHKATSKDVLQLGYGNLSKKESAWCWWIHDDVLYCSPNISLILCFAVCLDICTFWESPFRVLKPDLVYLQALCLEWISEDNNSSYTVCPGKFLWDAQR